MKAVKKSVKQKMVLLRSLKAGDCFRGGTTVYQAVSFRGVAPEKKKDSWHVLNTSNGNISTMKLNKKVIPVKAEIHYSDKV